MSVHGADSPNHELEREAGSRESCIVNLPIEQGVVDAPANFQLLTRRIHRKCAAIAILTHSNNDWIGARQN